MCAAVTDMKLHELREQLGGSAVEPRFDDRYLGRFLLARKGDVAKARQMLEAHFKWREEKRVDDLFYSHLRKGPLPHRQSLFPEEKDLCRVYPTGYWGLDRKQRIIYYERLGHADFAAVLRKVTKERFLEYIIYQYERLIWEKFPGTKAETIDGTCEDKTCIFVDLRGLGWSHLSKTSRTLFRELVGISSAHYPEIMGRTFVLNTPRMFTLIWGGLQNLIDADTRKKISILSSGSKVMQALEEVVNVELLPEFLGGAVPNVRGVVDYGPWNPQDPWPPHPSDMWSGSHDSFVSCVEDEMETTERTVCCGWCGWLFASNAEPLVR